MKKNGSHLYYLGLAVVAVVAFFAINHYVGKEDNKTVESEKNTTKIAETEKSKPADKIQVFLFHSTQRCITCINIGKYAQKTVEQKFPEEVKSGKIEFREINIDLPENKELATKFRATGSSLFINPIVDGEDNIQVDTQVWRLTSNEQAFISYLSDKLKAML